MATKSAGRVSIRVLPDSTGFKRDLEKTLERIEKQLKAKIRAELFIDRASLAALKRQIESLVVKIKPAIELNVSLKELDELKAKIESIKPKVTINLDTKEAAARIAALTRTRTVDIRANVNQAGLALVEGFATRLRAMAGLNLVMDSLRAGSEFMNNIDRKAVEFAQTMTRVAGLVGTIGSTLASAVTIGGDALSVGKLGLLAPAFLTSAGIGIASLVVVLKDMGTVLADLGPRFTNLQDKMSKEFWDKAAQPIRDLTNKYFPTLDDRLQQTARNWGRVFKTMAETISENMSVEDLDNMFIRLNDAVADIQPTVQSLTKSFITLGKWGVNYLPRFINWMNKLTGQFDNFITKAASDGRLDKWAEQGIKAFFDLGRVIGGVAETLNGIYRAAQRAGAPTLTDFANGMERMADIVQSPRFQTNLTMLFQGMLELTDGIARGIKNLGPDIESFLPTLTNILGRFGKIFEDVFGVIGTIISNVEFQKGLSEFVGGIEKAFDNLKGGVDPLATSFGNLLGFMSEVLDMGTRLLNEVFTKLGPKFDDVLEALKPFLAPIEDLANTAIGVVETILDGLAKDVLPPLKTLFVELKDPVKELLEQFKPEIVNTLKTTGDGLTGLGHAVSFLKDALKELEQGGKYEWLGTTIKNINDMLSGGDQASLFTMANPGSGFGTWFGKVVGDWINSIDWAGITAKITEMWTTFWNHVVDGWNRIWSGNIFGDQPGKFISETIENLKTAVKPLTDFIDGLFGGGDTEGPTVGGGGKGGRSIGGFIGLDNTDMSWFETLKTNMTGAMGSLGQAFTVGGETAKLAWTTFWDNLGTGIETTWETLKLVVQTKMGEVGTAFTTGGETAKLAWDTWWTNLNTGLGTIWETLKLTASTKFGEMGTTLQTAGATVKTGWDTFWTGVGTILSGKFGEMSQSTTQGMGNIESGVKNPFGAISSVWNGNWAGLGATLTGKWTEFISTVTTKAAQFSPQIQGMLSQVSSIWQGGWQSLGPIISGAWAGFSGTISGGIANAVGIVRGFPGLVQGALGNLAGLLVGSGSSLVSGFAAGIRAAMPQVSAAASAVAAAARAFFPNSPAKKGPFSGKGYTPWSGRALVKDFAGGMMDNMSMVKDAAAKVTNAAQIGANLNSFSDLETKMTITKKEVNLTVINPQAEPTSRSIESASAAVRIAGDL